MMNAQQVITVQPKIPFYCGIILWVIGWCGLLFFPEYFSAHSALGSFMDSIINILLLAVALTVGPIGVLLHSWKMKIDGKQFLYSNFLGIAKQSYSITNDIKSVSLTPQFKRKQAQIIINLKGEKEIKVNELASGFQNLWSFLENNEQIPKVQIET